MRAVTATLFAAAATIALAACSGAGAQSPTEAPVEAATTTEAPAPTPDPDAPADAVFAKSDSMAHTMCQLWTNTLDDPAMLRDVADDVHWYSSQTNNDFLNSTVGSLRGWGAEEPGVTTVLCGWNGYTPQDGSPSDLLG